MAAKGRAQASTASVQIARIYLRVSSDSQDLDRQEQVVESARGAGYYIAGIYREKASGARADRPELQRLISDLQPGDVVIAEKMDRITRLPLEQAEQLIESIRSKGARLAIPGLVDLSELAKDAKGTMRIVLEAVQDMLMRIALQSARDDYETRRDRQAQGIALAKAAGKYKGRRANKTIHDRIIALRSGGESIANTAQLAGCSVSQVKRIWSLHQSRTRDSENG